MPRVDSGNPGSFRFTPKTAASGAGVVFTTNVIASSLAYNGLGSQGLFVPPGVLCPSCSAGAGAATSVDALLAILKAANPSAALNLQSTSPPPPGSLFAAASATAVNVSPGDSVSLTVAHAWHYPRFFWYVSTSTRQVPRPPIHFVFLVGQGHTDSGRSPPYTEDEAPPPACPLKSVASYFCPSM